MIKQAFVTALTILLIVPFTMNMAISADKDAEKNTKTYADLSKQEQYNVLQKQLRSLAAEHLAKLGPNELEVIYNIRADHGIIQTVKGVQNDMALASKSCIEKNEDMQGLVKALNGWNQDLNPLIDQAQQGVEKAASKQKILDKQVLIAYLGTIDLMARIKEDQLEKKYITDKKSCQELEKKIGKTKKKLISLLKKSIASADL